MRLKPCLWALLGAGALLLGPAGVQAQTMSCGRDFAQLGDSKAEVTLKCGAPVATDQYCRKGGNPQGFSFNGQAPDTNPARPACEWVDEWTYRPPSGQFITQLQFENGRLVAIHFGDRVP